MSGLYCRMLEAVQRTLVTSQVNTAWTSWLVMLSLRTPSLTLW